MKRLLVEVLLIYYYSIEVIKKKLVKQPNSKNVMIGKVFEHLSYMLMRLQFYHSYSCLYFSVRL